MSRLNCQRVGVQYTSVILKQEAFYLHGKNSKVEGELLRFVGLVVDKKADYKSHLTSGNGPSPGTFATSRI